MLKDGKLAHCLIGAAAILYLIAAPPAQAAPAEPAPAAASAKPNILILWGDDIG